MSGKRPRFFRFMAGISFWTVVCCAFVPPAQTHEHEVARAVSVQGNVEARRLGETQWQPVTLNDTYAPGDMIRVLERSRADLALLNQTVLRLDANTTLTFEAVQEQRTGVVNLLKDIAHFFSRGPRSLEVHTPFISAGVQGTEFLSAWSLTRHS